MNKGLGSEEQMEMLRYPIRRFIAPDKYDNTWKAKAIDSIRYLPRIELAIENMDERKITRKS